MSNQELIDKAVHALSGDYKKSSKGMGFCDSFLWHIGDGRYQGLSGQSGFCGEFICTKEEFQQRASELGYINGYRWGIEYNPSDKAPNLPKDTLIVWTDGTRSTQTTCYGMNWVGVKSFRITDQRYKPADTSYLDNESSSLDNSDEWYDYDNQKAIALPPVGTECEAFLMDTSYKNAWFKVEIIKNHFDRECACMRIENRGLTWCNTFRPLDHNRKAEAEKNRVVDKLKHDVYLHAINNCEGISMRQSTGETLAASVIEYLYDAGYLKLPE